MMRMLPRPEDHRRGAEAALKKMRPGKATGPDDVAAYLWKSTFWYSAEWLAKFFNQVVAEKKAPDCWNQSTTISTIWKKKDSPADCSNYRPIRLLSHSMKTFERIVDGQIRDIVQLSTDQCGFLAGCGTVDAIHAARLLTGLCLLRRRVGYAVLRGLLCTA
ncbi:unnamed protein product [Heligmosomoides polygyrus]|uniref:Reverse transcriptase domain-containing protein n=1 Tax=Heligmosomoides polygyrus TaxID=6339 RepID=A0A183GUZ5_HELPZ|nr:unnamed protein product [Heligmosomoides polygyrus]